MAGLDMSQEDPYRVGVIIGSGVGSLQAIEREHQKLLEKGPAKVNLMLVPMMISNMAAGNVSIQLGARGKCTDVVTACASGTHSIGDAFRAIQYGDAEVMIAGGTENAITPIGVSGFTNLTALTTCNDPERASIPFDKDRSGFVLGEGAGIVILEELEHAKARGAKILAEMVGYGATGDAHHVTAPIEDGSGAAKAMSLAMEEAGKYMETVEMTAKKIAFGVAACIFSPVILIILSGLAEQKMIFMNEDMAGGIGTIFLLLIIAGAVTLTFFHIIFKEAA